MKKLIIFVSKFQKLKTIDNGIVSKKRILPKSGLIPNEIENIQSNPTRLLVANYQLPSLPSFCFAAFGLLELKIFPGC